jgi:hypothetical protein
VEALARLARSHLVWVGRQEREGRPLAMDDLEVIEVRGRGCVWLLGSAEHKGFFL